MRLDHIAYRVADRKKTAKFFIEAFGYKVQQEFKLEFDDGTTTDCIALEPPEKLVSGLPWAVFVSEVGAVGGTYSTLELSHDGAPYHVAPEIFVSDGVPDSIVGKWVAERGGIGGIHHLAYQVESVEKTMKEWQDKGYCEFSSDKPLGCTEDNLVQVFSKPSLLTGVIYEFIQRGEHGFCRENVKALMESSKNYK